MLRRGFHKRYFCGVSEGWGSGRCVPSFDGYRRGDGEARDGADVGGGSQRPRGFRRGGGYVGDGGQGGNRDVGQVMSAL